ncbi:hypothetical protein, partial [Bacillus haynesii]|uniref:hypothetical protein n=1 Tax=Bacillus haynesii TaxID=1925021 RepID=UPI0022827560
ARRITIIAKRTSTIMSIVKKTTITTSLAKKTATMSRAKNAMIRLIKRKMIHGFISESMFCMRF